MGQTVPGASDSFSTSPKELHPFPSFPGCTLQIREDRDLFLSLSGPPAGQQAVQSLQYVGTPSGLPAQSILQLGQLGWVW